MTEGYPFRFAGAGFIARPSGALWWPDRRMLVVADLHLGRAERYARRGGALLPPFEVQDTLERLASEIAALDPARVVSLGDAFDDDPAAHHIGAKDAALLRDMARDRDWIWISGNHDPGRLPANLSGVVVPDLPGAITLRHQAGEGPDISGHMHPSTRLAGRRFRCFVVGARHLILPAFGTYTGGLDLTDPAFAPLATGGMALACSARVFARPVPTQRRKAALRLGMKTSSGMCPDRP